jgi:hypothetical protein
MPQHPAFSFDPSDDLQSKLGAFNKGQSQSISPQKLTD